MESSGVWEQENLINELTRGRALAQQLQTHLNVPSFSSQESSKMLAQQIINSYEKALSMLKWNNVGSSVRETQHAGADIGILSELSPRSLSGSPWSEDSDRDFRDFEHKDGSRKRKIVPRWTKQVQVCPGTGLEGPLDDGFCWRKYGQKDILGAKYPRGYYRCIHRNIQGCLATKQVQRSDDNPNIFEINYRGRHTCTQQPTPPVPSASPQNQERNMTLENHQLIINQPPLQEMPLNFQTSLKDITEDLGTQSQIFPSFYFPSTSQENHFVHSPPMIDENLMGNFSPSLVSPTASGSNYFSASSSSQNLMASESELSKVVSSATHSSTNSPNNTFGLEFLFGSNMDQFETGFSFDNHGFFS